MPVRHRSHEELSCRLHRELVLLALPAVLLRHRRKALHVEGGARPVCDVRGGKGVQPRRLLEEGLACARGRDRIEAREARDGAREGDGGGGDDRWVDALQRIDD